MPTTKVQDPKKQARTSTRPVVPADVEVLTLAEAAYFLRVPEPEVLRLVTEQDLPGRATSDGWRFLKEGLRNWLGSSRESCKGQDFWESQLDAFKDDPHLAEMVEEIYKKRGRPMIEEG